MAAIQVAAIVLGLRLARRVDQLTTQVERDIRPLLQNLTDMTAEAQRAVQLATAQVERVDRLFGDLAVSAERTIALATPVRRRAGAERAGAVLGGPGGDLGRSRSARRLAPAPAPPAGSSPRRRRVAVHRLEVTDNRRHPRRQEGRRHASGGEMGGCGGDGCRGTGGPDGTGAGRRVGRGCQRTGQGAERQEARRHRRQGSRARRMRSSRRCTSRGSCW